MLKRIYNLSRSLCHCLVSAVEKRSPEALLEVEKENLRKQIANYNQGLAAHASLCERLMAHVRKLETEERDLRASAGAHLRAGNRGAAGQYALRLETVRRELAENREQLTLSEETYRELVRARDVSVKAAQDRIAALKHSLNDLKIKRASAELTEMAAGLVNRIGGAGDTLDRLSGIVEEQRDLAAGRVRVARSALSAGETGLKETERDALAEQALADFLAHEELAGNPEPARLPPMRGGRESR